MKSWIEEMNGQGSRIGGAAIWTVAAVAVLGAHAAGAALLLRERPAPPADDAAPALMLELSAMPEAVNTDNTNIADQFQDTAEVLSKQVEPIPEPEPEPEPEEMVEDLPPPPPEPIEEIEEEIDVPVEQPEVVLPRTRPERRPEREIVEKKEPPKERREEPKKRREAPASVAQTRSAAQVQQSTRNASTANGGTGSAANNAKWVSKLNAHLQRHRRKFNGTARRDVGIVRVRFTIDSAGNVLSVSLVRSSGLPALDDNALSTVRRASPVPPPPPENPQRTFEVPLKFDESSFH